MVANRFEVWNINLDPTKGSEMKKTRPCVVVSPDEMNAVLNTVIVAPLTHTVKGYPSRVESFFQGQRGEVALDQIRSVDKTRLTGKLGVVDAVTAENICATLQEMFQY